MERRSLSFRLLIHARVVEKNLGDLMKSTIFVGDIEIEGLGSEIGKSVS